MVEDSEGFRYPVLDGNLCVNCGQCNKACPIEHPVAKHQEKQLAFGGYASDEKVRCLSTSGGAFSCLVESWCDDECVIFGAETTGLEVCHNYVSDKQGYGIFRKSKYSQSHINDSYQKVRSFLSQKRNVLFSGTPCQIAGLLKYLSIFKTDTSNLLTVEVVCEGVPSPLYIRKMNRYIESKYGAGIKEIDYRFKDGKYDYTNESKHISRKGRWDYELMELSLKNGKKLRKDRWFNPFWNIWLNHLMSRPSCYKCPYTTQDRVADVTLGDLWGVHIYCPELYGSNGGSSLVFSNTDKGHKAVEGAKKVMYGHELVLADAVRYQSPMRKCISMNPNREAFFDDLKNPEITYSEINSKWAKKPSLRLLISKYIWGNHRKVKLWKIKRKLSGK